ncbi:hypothetical protein C8Q72DRAFT_422764 [Fomitopsis betulina]|nr:hypothetical protein C8Q72DRAFT_422764 [Fomitopsis betulina]
MYHRPLRRPGAPEVVTSPSNPSMSLFTTLNLDVLDHILSFTEIYDTLMLSFTCRDGQRIATRRFLGSVTFPLPWLWLPGAKRSLKASWELYDSFTAYMLAPGTHRLEYLKDLTFNNDAFRTGFAGSLLESFTESHCGFTLAVPLADVVRGATGLRRLCIGNAESVFEAASQLVNAIACDLRKSAFVTQTSSRLPSCPRFKAALEKSRSTSKNVGTRRRTSGGGDSTLLAMTAFYTTSPNAWRRCI